MNFSDQLFYGPFLVRKQNRDEEKLARPLFLKIEPEVSTFVQEDVGHDRTTHYQKRLEN